MIRALIPDRLYIADIEGCTCKAPQLGPRVATRVHACKNPCHYSRVGQLTPDHKSYIGFEEAGELILNMIDADRPLFQRQSFEMFLRFCRRNWSEQRPIIIHCNKGKSRAPTLALLFMAKCLGVIPNSSYDDAWDRFEETFGPYEPSKGIEDWMRANWHSISAEMIGGASLSRRKFARYIPPDTSGITKEEAVALVQGSPIVHFATMVTIEDKKHERIVPVPNVLQMQINEAYELCKRLGIPIRLQVLKPRQVGCSTGVGHLFYHHCRQHQVDGMIIGDEASRTMKVWQIFTDYAKADRFAWDSQFYSDTKKAVVTYRDGTLGQWEYDTANDPKAGISGTRQAIWYTEAARYSKSGARTDVKVITASLASLAKIANSLAVMESTADGASGFFYENWQDAVTIDELRAGKFGNGWVKIFAAWFEFAEHTLPRLPQYEQYFSEHYSLRELRGIELYGWDKYQIAWRRYMIANECKSEAIFDQDYPENDRDCFLQSGRPRFDDAGVTRLEYIAAREYEKAERGVLASDGVRVMFIPTSDRPWIWMKERPIPGCSYIAPIDPCMGEQSAGARDPDAHAPCIIRVAYMDGEGVLHPDEVVAAIDVENGCRWDDTVVAERFAMLADFYGKCMVAPETGNGLGVLVKLRDFGANIFQRQKEDAYVSGKFMPVAGWETNASTRDLWVNAIADAIRDSESFRCAFLPAVKEMRTFIIDDRGKAQAAPSKHDDWVASIGIGLYLKKFATVYYPPRPVFIGDDSKRAAGTAFS